MHHVYLRVSTDHQDEASQKAGIVEYLRTHGDPPTTYHADTASGASSWRSRGLAALLDLAEPGDWIVAAEISRFGRSTVDVLDFIREAQRRQLSLLVTKSNLTIDQSLHAKITTTILALASEIEREFIRARTQEGVDRARAAGKQLGRPKGAQSAGKLAGQAAEIAKLKAAGVSDAAIGRIFAVSRGTVARHHARVNNTTKGGST